MILQYIVLLSAAINNRFTDGKYEYFISTHFMDLPRCHSPLIICPVSWVANPVNEGQVAVNGQVWPLSDSHQWCPEYLCPEDDLSA